MLFSIWHRLNLFGEIMNQINPCLVATTRRLLGCVAQTNSDLFHDAILRLTQCLETRTGDDFLNFRDFDLQELHIPDTPANEFVLKFRDLFHDLLFNEHEPPIISCGWYLFDNRHTGNIDYIGVSGSAGQTLYQRIQHHFRVTGGSSFYNNVVHETHQQFTRYEWVSFLKANYRLLAIFTDYNSMDKYATNIETSIEDVLYVVESFLIGIFQPRYNRQ